MKIEKLNSKNLNDVKQVAEIMYNWWGKECGLTFDEQIKLVKCRAQDKFPVTFIIKNLCEVIGVISLIESEISSRIELSPMIGGLYVKSNYRNKRTASKLVSYMINYIFNNLDFKSVYLIASIKDFYERFCFSVQEELEKDNRIYRLDVK